MEIGHGFTHPGRNVASGKVPAASRRRVRTWRAAVRFANRSNNNTGYCGETPHQKNEKKGWKVGRGDIRTKRETLAKRANGPKRAWFLASPPRRMGPSLKLRLVKRRKKISTERLARGDKWLLQNSAGKLWADLSCPGPIE